MKKLVVKDVVFNEGLPKICVPLVGKTKEEINGEISDYFAKLQAIRDMNQERDVAHMDPHEKQFNRAIRTDTFDTDFSEFFQTAFI